MAPPLNRIILYARDVEAMVDFYTGHFGYAAQRDEADRIVELTPAAEGAVLMLHTAGKASKQGQAAVKLVFDVADVATFCEQALERGLAFGPLHRADGYVFANAKDPSGNSVSVSSRAFRKQ